MLKARIIPCLDCDGGRVVKGTQFKNLRDAGDPVARAARYEVEGADEIVVLDISATIEKRAHHRATIQAIREAISIPLTAGGGIRSIEDCELLLAAGADKISINSAAFRDPELIRGIAARFGSQCTVVAIDVRRMEGEWAVALDAGRTLTNHSALDWAQEASSRGAGELLLTSWDRDGTRSGYDLELLRAITSRVEIPVIASGGAAHAEDLADGYRHGASGLLIASILHDNDFTIMELKQELQLSGIPVRL